MDMFLGFNYKTIFCDSERKEKTAKEALRYFKVCNKEMEVPCRFNV